MMTNEFLRAVLEAGEVVDFAPFLYRDDGEAPRMVARRINRVLRVRARSPAVVAREAPHAVVDAYLHEVAGRDVVDVGLFGHAVAGLERVVAFSLFKVVPLVGTVGLLCVEVLHAVAEGVEFHKVRVGHDEQSLAVAVCQGQPAAVGLVAVFLRAGVGGVLLSRRGAVASHERAAVAVAVVLDGASAEIFKSLVCGRKAEAHAEARDFRSVGGGGQMAVHVQLAGGIERVGDAEGNADFRQGVFHVEAGVLAVNGGLGPAHLQLFASLFPCLRAVGQAVAVVVVRGAPPEIGTETEGVVDVFHSPHLVGGDAPPFLVVDEGGVVVGQPDFLAGGGRLVGCGGFLRIDGFLRGDGIGELPGGHLVSGGNARHGTAGLHAEVKEIFLARLVFGRLDRNGDLLLFAGGEAQDGELARFHRLAVGDEGVGDGVTVEVGEVVEVFDLDDAVGEVDGREPDVLVRFFHFGEAGMGLSVGTHHAVAEEVAVGGRVNSEVASVGPEGAAVLVHLVNALVDVVPDESPLEVGIAVDGFPKVHEVAGAVAHGVGVFRHDVGAVCATVSPFLEGVLAGVLGAENVGVPFEEGALVLHGAGGVPCFEPVVGHVEIVAVARLVAERPKDDTGVVLGEFVHVGGAVDVGVEPARVVAQRAAPAQVVVHAVRLDIGLVADVEPVLVAEFVEAALLGIVGASDGVDVVLFHGGEVFADVGLAEDVSGVLVVLVVVDALDEDGPAVHEVLVAPDFDFPEADAEGNDFGRFAHLLMEDVERVEVGGLGGPRLDIGDAGLETERGEGVDDGCLAAFGHDAPVGVRQLVAHGGLAGQAARVGHCHVKAEEAGGVGAVQVLADGEVPHSDGVLGEEVHVALNAAYAPKVLALEVAPCGPAVDFQGDEVAPRRETGCDVIFGGRFRVLVVAYFLPVDVDVAAGLGSADVEEHFFAFPVGGYLDEFAVGADGVFLRQQGRTRVAGGELVGMVGVDGRPVAVEFPIGGDVNFAPGRVVEAGKVEVCRAVFVSGDPVEFPFSVEGFVVGRLGEVVASGLFHVLVAHERRAGVFFARGGDCLVLPFRFPLGKDRQGQEAGQSDKKRVSHMKSVLFLRDKDNTFV